MAIIRQKRTGTQNKADTGLKKENGQTKRKIVRKNLQLASKVKRASLTRGRGNVDAKERRRAGQKNPRKERNPRSERKQREAPRSQLMYWLNRRNDNDAEERQFFLPPRQRPIRFRRIPPGLFPALYASLAILSIGGGFSYLISTQNQNGITVSTSSNASATSDVTTTTTNTNNPTITSTNTANQTPVTNTNNDNDTNTSNSNNPINNSGNTVTVNNPPRRRKRSMRRRIFQVLKKHHQVCRRQKQEHHKNFTEEKEIINKNKTY